MHTEFVDQTSPEGAEQSVDAIYDKGVSAKSTNCVLYAILARTENLHFAVNGRFMHRRFTNREIFGRKKLFHQGTRTTNGESLLQYRSFGLQGCRLTNLSKDGTAPVPG